MIAGGLVWVTDYPSALYGLDPTTGTTRSQFPIPETGSDVNHFASPSAGGGRLFVASGDQVKRDHTVDRARHTQPRTVLTAAPASASGA